MTHYPTDALIALRRLDRALRNENSELSRLFADEDLLPLRGLFRAENLDQALDGFFGGTSQYPYSPSFDRNDTIEWTPVGRLYLSDLSAFDTFRGLLVGLTTENAITVGTQRIKFWSTIARHLREAAAFVTDISVRFDDGPAEGETPFSVPPICLETSDGFFIAQKHWNDAPFASPLPRPPVGAVVLASQEDSSAILRRCVADDVTRSWATTLVHQKLHLWVSLAQLRSRDASDHDRLSAQLRYLLDTAADTAFYAMLPQVHSIDELATLPILTKADLDAHAPPTSTAMTRTVRADGEVLRSGGTTGAPRYIVYSRQDWSNMVREAIPLYYALGLAPGDRIVNTLVGGSLYGGLTTSHSELSRMPVECYTTGHTVTAAELVSLRDSFGLDAIIGLPSLLLPLLRDAHRIDPSFTMATVIYGGSPMSESDKRWLRRALDTRSIASVLAANDGAQLGYQCSAMHSNSHHLCDEYNYLEVVDEHGHPLPDGTSGDLLVTNLQKFQGPLIRYAIGDRGSIERTTCPCGVSGRVLNYEGRADGSIKVKARTVLYSDIVSALARFGVSQVQVEISSENRSEVVTVRTESADTVDAAEIRQHLVSAFEALADTHSFADHLEVLSVVVECLPDGGLPRNSTSGKIRQVIDARLVTK
ncbi:phenylacetate--CoA ligase family protein [Rhodococcus qingshengii]|uniref:phenylacetate--CoA ligase family protein n=1 Tax=Rhodococcus qingshengii TaxID=334542 RepID=UPI00365D2B75